MNELGFKEAADLFGGKAIIAQVFYDIADASLGLEEFDGTPFCTARRGDVSAGTVAKLKQTFVLKFQVGFGDGVVADDKLFCERTDAGHQVAILQDAGLDGMTHLLHELEIKRMARGRVEVEDHEANCTTVLVHNVNPASIQQIADSQEGSGRSDSRRYAEN